MSSRSTSPRTVSPTHDGDAQDVLVVARMKIPTSAMFRIVQAMSANIDRYERQHGRITPRPPKEDTMSNNGSGPGPRQRSGRFRLHRQGQTMINVSISRPVSPEDVDRVRRQLAEWATRRPAQPA